MIHYIIVKFNDDVKYLELIDSIKELFNKSLDLDGVNSIEFHISCLDLANRYDLMIKMTLSGDGLSNFDNSYIHKEWKERFGSLISSKTIFDCKD
jgi:hypothetical protein